MARRSSSKDARDALLRVAGDALVEECKSYLDSLLPADAQVRLPSHDREEVTTTLRRDFLALSGYAAAGQVLGLLEGPLDMINMRLDGASTSDERISHIEAIAEDLGVQVVRVEPTAVLKPALTTLHAVRALLEERHPERQQVRLVQANARLSTVIGEILFNVGQFSRAREWYLAAERSARDAGDQYLADIALAGQAYLPLYSDDPRGVLALLSPRLEATTRPSPAIAWLWGFSARANAALDDSQEFRRSVERAGESLERSPSEMIKPGIFSFLPEKLGFYEATGAVQLNDPVRAIDAADRALSLYDLTETMEPALVRLERASALAETGEVPEACRAAKAALLEPNTYHGVTVRKYATRFDGLISGIDLPETRDWFEVRAAVHGRPPAGSPGGGPAE
jgi:tetratricopeptide (TPR) repeat protein